MTVEKLNKHRADKSNDCRDWTVIDALEDALERVKSGEIKSDKVYVAFGGGAFSAAGTTRLETIGLLFDHAHDRAG